MSDTKEEENLEFKWLKKRGIGGRRKEVQFYDSFVFDGEEYSLYDCVYMYKDGEPEPYIGKLIKIWEQPGNLKKVKVLWFFRPIEVVNHIGDEEVPENELFLASGKQDSRGLTNINPLEVIAGKCNVICTSKDVKNPQPSEEEMKAADYIFYRTFNVDTFKISDEIDEKIASVEVKFIYNRTGGKEPGNIFKLGSGKTDENGKIGGSDDVSRPPVKLNAQGLPDSSVRVENEQLVAPGVIHDSLPCETVAPNEAATTLDKQDNVVCRKEAQIKLEQLLLKRSERDGKVNDTSTTLVQEKGNLKPVNSSDEADRPSKKARVDSSVKPSKKPQPKISKSLSLSKNKKEASPQISKKDGADNLDKLSRETQTTVSNSSSLSKGKDEPREQPSKKARIGSPVKSTEEQQSTISNPLSLSKGKDKPIAKPLEKARDGHSTKTVEEPQPKISSPSSFSKEKNKDAVQTSKETGVDNAVKSSEEPQPTISSPSSLNKDKNEATAQPSKNIKDINSIKSSYEPQPKISSPSSFNKEKNKDDAQTSKQTRVDNLVKSSKETQPTVSSLSSFNKDKNKAIVQPFKNGKDGNSIKSSNEPHPTISTPSVVLKEKMAGVQECIILVDSDEDDVVGVSGAMGSALEDVNTSKVVVDSHVQEKATLKDVKPEKETNTDDQTVEVGKRPETVSALEDTSTSKAVVDSHVQEKATLTDVKAGEKKKRKLSNGNPSKPAVSRCTEKETNTDVQTVEVGKRPETVSALEDMSTSKAVVDSHVQEKATLTDVKPREKKKRKLSNGNPSKPAVSRCSEEETNTDDQTVEVGRRPQTDRSKWFKGLPWEERMETAHDQGTLVLLENLDPSYTSAEVEDIIWHGFQENCTAKVVAQTAISSPHSGRAYVIFKTRDAAELATEKLDAGCLMLPNGRPLVASRGNPPKRGKASTLVGHLFIEKIKLQTQREDIKKAVSTSHCSQPNTVEYEMALEWCLLQTRADKYWKELYKQQGEEMRKLNAELKFK
ncbi:protein ANTI-SILENCING 1-like isoform X2 [Papaver somniferum]|uniref:protein ANTI-SILENCING 1-like isoform X2 n=1 Tax=Papaver somniferum TaxID=3469 RepID=UPI000E6F9F70|nr:protein ANTI-SILENCING 1-like isoform X2 [Papaver somniferum]